MPKRLLLRLQQQSSLGGASPCSMNGTRTGTRPSPRTKADLHSNLTAGRYRNRNLQRSIFLLEPQETRSNVVTFTMKDMQWTMHGDCDAHEMNTPTTLLYSGDISVHVWGLWSVIMTHIDTYDYHIIIMWSYWSYEHFSMRRKTNASESIGTCAPATTYLAD